MSSDDTFQTRVGGQVKKKRKTPKVVGGVIMNRHRQIPFGILSSDLTGRYLVAMKNFMPGQLIFEEAPAFVYSEFEESRNNKHKKTCILCYKIVATKEAHSCQQCNWPFCSQECSEDPSHRDGECLILQLNQVKPSRKALRLLYLLRFEVMREMNRNNFDAIMTLASTYSPDCHEIIEKLKEDVEDATKFMTEIFNVDVSYEHIHKVISIFRINTFTLTQPDRTFCCLYGTCSLMAHSCAPNMDWEQLPREGRELGTMGFFTRDKILAGEMVTICYADTYINQGTRQRQLSMFENYGFYCACARCSDPSELKTFYSALKCSKCVDGWLLPSSVCSKDSHSYNCNDCSMWLPATEVDRIEYRFKRKLFKAIQAKKPFCKGKYELRYLDQLIDSATSTYRLHPNHHLVIEAIERWLDLQDTEVLFKDNSKSKRVYSKIMMRAKRGLVVQKLFGNADLRAEMDAIISNTLVSYNFKSKDGLTIRKDMNNLNAKIRVLKEVVTHLEDGIRFSGQNVFAYFDTYSIALIRSLKKDYSVWQPRLKYCMEQAVSIKERLKRLGIN